MISERCIYIWIYISKAFMGYIYLFHCVSVNCEQPKAIVALTHTHIPLWQLDVKQRRYSKTIPEMSSHFVIRSQFIGSAEYRIASIIKHRGSTEDVETLAESGIRKVGFKWWVIAQVSYVSPIPDIGIRKSNCPIFVYCVLIAVIAEAITKCSSPRTISKTVQ